MSPRAMKSGALPIYVRYCLMFLLAQMGAALAGTLLLERGGERLYESALKEKSMAIHRDVASQLSMAAEDQWPRLVQQYPLAGKQLSLQRLDDVHARIP